MSTQRATVGPWLVVGDETDDLLQAIAAELRQRGEIVRTAAGFDPERLLPARAVAVVGAAGNDTTGLDRAASRWLGDTVDVARSLGR